MKSVVEFDRISISIDVTFVRMISHFPLFLPTFRDLVANLMHRCGIAWWSLDLLEYRLYTTHIEMVLRLTLEHSRINFHIDFVTVNFHITPYLVLVFYLWRSREWLTLSYVLEIVHYYDLCPFTIFLSRPSWSFGSWIYKYLCNQCHSFHHLSCEFEFWFSPHTPVSATNKTDLHDITEILLKVVFNTITLILTVFSFLRLLR